MSVPSLYELYAEPSQREAASIYSDVWYKGLDRMLENLGPIGHITTAATLSAQLDALKAPSDQLDAAACLLGCLPVRQLLYEFGESTTGWVLGNDNDYRAEQLAEKLGDEGYDKNLLWQSRLLAEHRDKVVSGAEIWAQNRVMEAVLGGRLAKIDVARALYASLRPDMSPSAVKPDRYGLMPLQAEHNTGYARGRVFEWEGEDVAKRHGLQYDMYLDTPVAWAITYRGLPQAIAGVRAEGTTEIFIRQMQGLQAERLDSDGNVTGYQSTRGLSQFDWRKLLVHITAQLGQGMEMESVGIVAGKDVPATYYNYISPERARQVYDEPARQQGFIRDREGTWHKPIAEILGN